MLNRKFKYKHKYSFNKYGSYNVTGYENTTIKYNYLTLPYGEGVLPPSAEASGGPMRIKYIYIEIHKIHK